MSNNPSKERYHTAFAAIGMAVCGISYKWAGMTWLAVGHISHSQNGGLNSDSSSQSG